MDQERIESESVMIDPENESENESESDRGTIENVRGIEIHLEMIEKENGRGRETVSPVSPASENERGKEPVVDHVAKENALWNPIALIDRIVRVRLTVDLDRHIKR